MSKRDLVPFPGGVLVDESSYYGDHETKAEYEEDLRDFDPREFWRTHEKNYQLVKLQAELRKTNAGVKRKRDLAEDISKEGGLSGSKKLKQAKNEDADAKDESTPSTVTASPSPEPTAPTIFDNPFQGAASGKQTDESIADFLKRVPPSTSTSMDIKDSWIRVANPKVKHTYSAKIANFKESGFAVLEALGRQRAQLEAENPSKAPGSITRMMKPYREGAEAQLAQLAKGTGVTSGKWLLFPRGDEVDRIWRTVAEATWEGQLGQSAKVAPLDAAGNEKDERVICIYTHDFADDADVKVVLASMRDLSLVQDRGNAKPVYYKCDFVTYLDLMSGNEYKIPTSMYNSRDMFKEMAKGRRKS